jgi:AAA domain/Bifunctional DNA primase/polymerase, N-terminal
MTVQFPAGTLDTATLVPADLPQIAKPRELTDLRLKLHANGYHPVPLIGAHIKTKSAGKRPNMTAWQDKCLNATPHEIAEWSRDQGDCTNTGILVGEIVGVDIDVLDNVFSAKLEARAEELFGHSPLRRIGRAPKVLLVYRVATPIRKLQTSALIFGDDPETKDPKNHAKIEILAEGQQFVSHGIHPDTCQLYQWPNRSPLDIPASDVPLVALEMLQQFVVEAEQLLRAVGGRTKAEIEAEKVKEPAPTAPRPKSGGVLEMLGRQSGGAITKAFADANAGAVTFFTKVNALALVSRSEWVPALFPTARFEPGTGAYRVTSKDLGRDLEEDLSISPKGIKDWGVADQGDPKNGKRSPIDLVIEHKQKGLGSTRTPTEAALWLCERLKVPPEALGWNRVEGESTPDAVLQVAAQRKPIRATSYVWKDPATIPQRQWLYGGVLLRKFVTASVAPGAVGKSSLLAAEALAMVSGKNLLGTAPDKRLRVWLWNLEDPIEETTRKIQAGAIHYKLGPDDIGDRLMVDSGREQELVIATAGRDGPTVFRPVVEELVAEIKKHKIDVVIIDPFISSHKVPENDNGGMDTVVKEWGRVADRGDCAVHLVHHTRKPPTGGDSKVTVNSGRGASSQTDACREVRTLNKMSEKEATSVGISKSDREYYFRTDSGKPNLRPPAEKSEWYRLVSVELGNGPMKLPGDSIGVVTKWEIPAALDGMTGAQFEKVAQEIRGGKWRSNPQASAWVGKAIAEALDLDLTDDRVKAKIKRWIVAWLKAKSLVEVERVADDRKIRAFIEVAEND